MLIGQKKKTTNYKVDGREERINRNFSGIN